ncbi:MAG: hypothetical protein VYE22_09995 [Myxococcota bacterium]|nr:hypothetical protein [Myxococcota bacterium]
MDLQEIIQTAEDAAPWVLGVLIATTALAHALARAARAFERYARTTPATWDDEAARRAVRWADGLAAALDWISALMPRIGLGRVPTEAPARKARSRRGPPDALVALLVAGAMVLGAGLLQACGTAAQQHRSLNALTTIADPTYEEVVQLCDRMRDRIVERSGTTREQDREDMDEVNDACDVAVLKLEGLRGTQLTARAFIDSGEATGARTAVREAFALWPAIQRQAERLFAGGEQ